MGRCLRERGWAGDEELASELREVLGERPASGLQPLPVDLDELADLLESGDFDGGVVDRILGDVWTHSAMEYAQENEDPPPDFEDASRWLDVGPEGPNESYRDMRVFIGSLGNTDAKRRLLATIEGRGAFRRFRSALSRWPDVETSWYRFSDDRRRGRAREWLADAGYRVDRT